MVYWTCLKGVEEWITPEKFAVRMETRRAYQASLDKEKNAAYYREYTQRNLQRVRETKAASKARINASLTEEQKEKLRADERARYARNRDRIIANQNRYRDAHREALNEKARNLKVDDPEKHKAFLKRRRESKSDLARIAESSRVRMRIALGKEKSRSTTEYIGCSWEELRSHLESQFKEGMTWDNYGLYGWHIDHIIPLASAESIEDLIPLLHFTNLQPLWAIENMKKGAKMPVTR